MKGSLSTLTSVFIGLFLGWLVFDVFSDRTIINRISPDDNSRIKLIEKLPIDEDRHFYLELKRIHSKPKIIYRSRNEDYPGGSERIIWSSDSSRFILVGRHFDIWAHGKKVSIPTGEFIYLMYEIESDRLLCNIYAPEWCDAGYKLIKRGSNYYITGEPVVILDDLLQYEWESPLGEARPISSPVSSPAKK